MDGRNNRINHVSAASQILINLTRTIFRFSWDNSQVQPRFGKMIIDLFICLVALALVSGCPRRSEFRNQDVLEAPNLNSSVPAKGSYHLVTRDESLSRIARRHGLSVQVLAEVNNLKPPYVIRDGQKLFVPNDSLEPKSEKTQSPVQVAEEAVVDRSKLVWPVKGALLSEFGVREGAQHNGITIKAPEGAPVVAAENGIIGYVGSIPGYGNVILIEHPEHPDKLVTVYAHLKETRATNGRRIGRAEPIGSVGTTGRADAPSLYFEVRSKSKPRNPLFFLDRPKES